MGNYIERFSTRQRVLHWIVTASFFTLLLSGVGLFSRLFNGYFNLFGGGQNAIFVHKIAGVIFFFSSVYMYLDHRKEISTFDDNDKEWFRQFGGYLSRARHHFHIGRYNPGQKLFALFIAFATIVLGGTGVIIWSPTVFARGIVQFALMLHGLMFVASLMFMVLHIYLATIGNPGTIQAMLYGDVRKEWAKHHHPRWYGEQTGDKREV